MVDEEDREEESRDRDVPERAVRTLLRGPDDRNDDDDNDNGGVGVEELYRSTFDYRDQSSYATDKRHTVHATLSTRVRSPRPLNHRRQSLRQSPIYLPIRMSRPELPETVRGDGGNCERGKGGEDGGGGPQRRAAGECNGYGGFEAGGRGGGGGD